MPIVPSDFLLPFSKKEQIAKDAWTFYFDRSAKPDFDFVPGQYIRMTLDILQPDERGNGRFFSISSSPLTAQFFTITTRILESVFKKTLSDLKPGSMTKFFGPVGRFTLNEDDTRPLVFLAGGIGITSFYSMLKYASEKNLSVPVALIVSFSTTEEIVFYDELQEIAARHKNIKIIYTVTKSEASQEPWNGEAGRISVELIKKYAPEFLNSVFYISGPPAMVDAMLVMVKDMGVPDAQVKKEKFTGY